MTLPAQIISTQHASDRSGVKLVIYGRPSVGKTVLCATAPRPLIISAEHGLLSLRKYNLPCWPVYKFEDLEAVFTFITQSNDARLFDTICFDSISDMAEQLLAFEKATNPNKKDGFAAYNNLAEKFMNALRKFRALQNKHVYFIAKEEYDKDEATGMRMFQPSMPGRVLTNAIPYLVDEIFRLFVHTETDGTQSRWLQTQVSPTVVAKDRSGVLAPYEHADLTYLFGKMMAAY